MSIIKKIISLMILLCFIMCVHIVNDYKRYKEIYHLSNQAFIEYNLKKIEVLEKEVSSIINEKRLIPNLWDDWYFERDKQMLFHLKKYKDYLSLLEKKSGFNLSNDLSICLLKDKLKEENMNCYQDVRDKYFVNPEYDNLEFWTIHILLNKELAVQDLNKISNKVVYDMANSMLTKNKKEIIMELYPD